MIREIFFLEDPGAHPEYWRDQIEIQRDSSTGLWKAQLYHWIARYSLGDELGALRTSFVRDVASGQCPRDLELENVEDYLTFTWWLSLCDRFDCLDADAIPQQYRGRDAMIDGLLKLDMVSPRLIFKDVHLPLQQLLGGKGNPRVLIQQYLRSYYPFMSGCSWYDSHMDHSPSFFGYWSFLLPVLVDRLDLDDIEYANHMFYPRDLVEGQKLYRSFEDSAIGAADRAEYSQRRQSERTQADLLLIFHNLSHELRELSRDLLGVLDEGRLESFNPKRFLWIQTAVQTIQELFTSGDMKFRDFGKSAIGFLSSLAEDDLFQELIERLEPHAKTLNSVAERQDIFDLSFIRELEQSPQGLRSSLNGTIDDLVGQLTFAVNKEGSSDEEAGELIAQVFEKFEKRIFTGDEEDFLDQEKARIKARIDKRLGGKMKIDFTIDDVLDM